MMVLRKLYLVPFLFYRIWLAGKKYIGDYMPGFLIGKKISTHAIQAVSYTHLNSTISFRSEFSMATRVVKIFVVLAG